jgi:glycosyltransferase involved in cell wall biosynthesis
MRLLLATPYFPPSIGGAQAYARTVACGLAATGAWEVVVVTTNHEAPRRHAEEEQDGVRVIRLPRWLKVSNTPVSPLWRASLRALARRVRPDLVNGHAPVPLFADAAAQVARELGVPFVLTYHAGSMVRPGFWLNGVARAYERFVLARTCALSRRIVCSSEFVRRRLARPHAVTITPGVRGPEEPVAAATGRRVLFVGSLDRSSSWKGVDVLIDAMRSVQARFPDALLTVVGCGDREAHYRRRCARAGVRAEFRGARRGSELSAEYARCAVLVLPSLTEAESFGMVLVEAMAHRRPVVGSRVGGIPLVVRDGHNGLLVPPGDAGALAGALIRLLADPELARALGASGEEEALREHGWALQVRKTDRLFREVLAG